MSTDTKRLVFAFDAKRLFNNFTGLGNYSRSIVRHLQEAHPEHQYHLFTPKAIPNEETDYFFNSDRFTIHSPSGFNPLWRTFGMATDINRLKPNIFHGLSHEIPFGIDKDIKTVVTFHDLIYEIYPKQFGWWDRKMYKLKYRSAAKRSQYIAAVSKSTKHDMVKLYHLNPDKIQVLYQSCSDIFQKKGPDTYHNNLLLPEGLDNYYLYVGSIIERKGLLTIVMAYAQLPLYCQKPLVIVGKGNNVYFNQVNDMIRYYKLEDKVHFISGITNLELIGIYDRSYCLIYPSVYEGFGIPVIESLFRKKPVITSDVSSLPEAGGTGAILINPYDIAGLQKAIVQLQDNKLYDQLAINGYDYVNERFTADITTEALHDYYLKIIGNINSEKNYL